MPNNNLQSKKFNFDKESAALNRELQEVKVNRYLTKTGRKLNKFSSKNKGYNLAKYNLTRKIKNLKGENRNLLKDWSRGNVNANTNQIAGLFKKPLSNDEKKLLELTRNAMMSRPRATRKNRNIIGSFTGALSAASAF